MLYKLTTLNYHSCEINHKHIKCTQTHIHRHISLSWPMQKHYIPPVTNSYSLHPYATEMNKYVTTNKYNMAKGTHRTHIYSHF